MSGTLTTATHGRVLVLTLDNPTARNSLSPQMYAAAMEIFETLDRNPDIGAVVITGAHGMFSAGGNLQLLRERRQQSPSVQADSIEQLHGWVSAMRTCTRPIVAAVEGAAAGAGFSLALACDMIVAAENAKFVVAYVNVALSPDGGASWQLMRSLPRAIAAEACMLGKPLTPSLLAQHGLINRVVPAGDALSTAIALAQELAEKAPNALQSIKELLNNAQDEPLHKQLDAEKLAFVANLFHPNAGEGINAFLDKRPPNFKP
jgi:enoyl-CoA hydratase/carnithine racemase